MTSLHHPPGPADHPDGLPRALVPVLLVLPAAGRPRDADRGRQRPSGRRGRHRARSRSATASTTRSPSSSSTTGTARSSWDLGESYRERRSVSEILERARRREPPARRSGRSSSRSIVGISVGVVSAIRRYSWQDKLTTILTAAASAIPVFVLGYLLIWAFAVYPNTARVGTRLGADEDVRHRPQHVGAVLHPGRVTSGAISCCPRSPSRASRPRSAARMTRGSMLEVLGADYMRTARAKGLRERAVVTRHGLRNAMLPVITLIGIDFGTVIGSAVLTETVFSWPGHRIADRRLGRPSATSRCCSA